MSDDKRFWLTYDPATRGVRVDVPPDTAADARVASVRYWQSVGRPVEVVDASPELLAQEGA